MSSAYLGIKKLKGKDMRALKVAARHNLREILAEIGQTYNDIKPDKVHLNIIIAGLSSSDEVMTLAARLLAESGARFNRKDNVCGVEVMFSLPPDTTIDLATYFSDCTRWAESYLKIPVLSSVIHLDEGAPHCHVLLLPIQGKKAVGGKVVGYKRRLSTLQTDFYLQVASKYGLSPQGKASRLKPADRLKGAELIVTSIVSEPDLLLNPDVERELMRMLSPNPDGLLRAIGIRM